MRHFSKENDKNVSSNSNSTSTATTTATTKDKNTPVTTLKNKPPKLQKSTPEQTHRILTSGISATVPPIRVVDKLQLPKKSNDLSPKEIDELENERYKNRLKEALGYVPEGYDLNRKNRDIPEFQDRHKMHREMLEQLLQRDDVEPEFKEKIREVFELEEMAREYMEKENSQDATDPKLEPHIPGVDYSKWSSDDIRNQPLSNLGSEYSRERTGHGTAATLSQILGLILAASLAAAVALGLARPGFERFIITPFLNKFRGTGKEEQSK